MKTIKIIDIFNKLVNGEEVPKRVKYDNYIWVFRKEFNDYWNDEQYLFISGFDMFKDARCFLNDEVEIIEEDKEIEELNLMFPICNDIKNAELGGFASIYKSNLINIKYKIDEIIDELNKIKKEGK